MYINYKVPFYTNTPDQIHCLQASMKMIYEYFLPEKIISFEKWDEITAHKPNLWTWTMSGLIWFKKNGFEVINIEAFDYEKFSVRGEKYLIDFFGEEVGKAQIKYSDIQQEISISKNFIQEIKQEVRILSLRDIRFFLDKGFIVLCNINVRALDSLDGYSGHFIVVKGCSDSNLILHDPGLPGREDFEVSDDVFNKAWAYPDNNAKNLVAIKFKK